MKIYNNKPLFLLYGLVNILLILILLTLLILIFNDIFILNRIGFVIFIGIHLFLLFFIKIHYLCIFYNDEKRKIEFHYNKHFGLRWQQKTRTVLLPLKQFDGYKISKDSMGITVLSFFKKEQKEQYELGPFHVGFISKKEAQLFQDTFGEAL
jgi:hypothetical protein